MPRHPANVRDYFDRNPDLLRVFRPDSGNPIAQRRLGMMWQYYRGLLKPPGTDKKLEKYIINMAALATLPGNPHHVAPIARRGDQEDMGKIWMNGFLSDIRMQEKGRPTTLQLVEAELRKFAQNKWPQLNWSRQERDGWRPPRTITEELFAAPTVTDAELDLLCRKASPISIITWVTFDFITPRRGAVFGKLYVPKKVNLTGVPVQLGWEIIHDWLRPKDQNHGIDLVTIGFLLTKLKIHYSTNPRYKPSQRERTEGCSIQHNGVWYQVVYSKLATDWVITTCYMTPSPGEFAIQ
jgi:hypothetical protein